MRDISKEELNDILEKHNRWLSDSNDGKRADLRSADLRYANLSYADLRSADLSYANLRYADLRSADLRYADLRYANLRSAIGNMRELKTILLDTYPITYTAEILQIGCERHLIKDWWKFTEGEIHKMDRTNAVEWWNKYKPFIKRAIKLSPAVATKKKELTQPEQR